MSTVNLVNDMRSIYNTKIAIKDALGTESDVFADYPGYILDYNTRLSYVEEHKADIEDIPSLDGYATEAYVNSAIAGVSIDLSSYVTKDELSAQSYITMGDVSACGYITQHQDLSDYAQKSYVVDYVNTYAPAPDLSGYVSKSELSACSYITLNDIPSVDLTSYVTKDELSAQSYLTSHQSLNGYATEQYVDDAIDAIEFPSAPDLTPYVTKTELSSQSYLTSIPSEYITQTELSSCGYITLADVPGTDLSNYVTYSYAYNTFISYSYLGDIEEITEYILGSGSSSAPENIYATKAELNSYVSKTSLESMSYITESDVAEMGYITMDDIDACGYITMGDVSSCGYITAGDIPSVVVPVIDENLIPKETGTYTLGDASHFYNVAYSYVFNLGNNARIQNDAGGISFRIGDYAGIRVGSLSFYPQSNNTKSLGTSSMQWAYTYTNNLILNGTNIMDIIGDVETLLSNI